MTANGTVKRIRIRVGGVYLDAELKGTRTAEEIYHALPAEGPLNVWGEEFYFKLPGVKDHRETATTQVKVGDVAFWGGRASVGDFFRAYPHEYGAGPRACGSSECRGARSRRCGCPAPGDACEHHPGGTA